MQSAGVIDIEKLLVVVRESFLPSYDIHLVFKSLWHKVAINAREEKLGWNVCIKIDDGTLVNKRIKVLFSYGTQTLHQRGFGPGIFLVLSLVHRVLSVLGQVPRDDINQVLNIIHQK